MPLFFVGLDLGQADDYSALALIEEGLWVSEQVDWDGWQVCLPDELEGIEWVPPSRLSPKRARQVAEINLELGCPPQPPIYLRHLERYELGTPYPEVIDRVIRLLTRPPIRHLLPYTRLLIDATGVGRPVLDSFRARGVFPYGITIHGGDRATMETAGPKDINLRVPKRDLVGSVQTLLQSRRLKIAERLPLADVLKKELLNFRVKVDPKTAHDSYSHWREGAHDDLVLGVACAAWFREFINRDVERRNREQGGYRVPISSDYVEPFIKGEPEPFIKSAATPSRQSNPWRGM